MIRIITLNLNGIRSAARKGWLEWQAAQNADVVCVQEVKAFDNPCTECLKTALPAGPTYVVETPIGFHVLRRVE